MGNVTSWWSSARSPTGTGYRPARTAVYAEDGRTEVWVDGTPEARLLVEFDQPADPRIRQQRLTDADGGEWLISRASCGCGAGKSLKRLKL